MKYQWDDAGRLAVDSMTHLQADIDISALNELSGTEMDPQLVCVFCVFKPAH